MGLPSYTPSPWQELHVTVRWAPVSAKLVWVSWLNVAPCHCAVVWHDVHAFVGNAVFVCVGTAAA